MVLQARKRLAGVILRTPLNPSPALSRKCGCSVFIKWESLQRTGVFKLRGAYNKMAALPPEVLARGVITASTGNHGLAVAFAAHHLGVPATVVVPQGASPLKVEKCHSYGARVVAHGDNYDEAAEYSRRLAEETGATLIHAYADPLVIAGQGTVAYEILEDLPETDLILVPVGGGGLISGVALWAKTVNPAIRVVGVQTTATHAFHDNYHEGKLFHVPIEETVADGLAGTAQLNLDIARRYVDDVILVEEERLLEAVRWTLTEEQKVVEPAGAVGIAALLQGKMQLHPDEKVVVIASGSNIRPGLLRSLLGDSSSVGV